MKYEADFKLKKSALQRHQIKVEQEVVESLDEKLDTLEEQKKISEEQHELLKDNKRESENKILEEQFALEEQARQRMRTILQNCEAYQSEFEQCLNMIRSRNDTVSGCF